MRSYNVSTLLEILVERVKLFAAAQRPVSTLLEILAVLHLAVDKCREIVVSTLLEILAKVRISKG